MFKLAFVLSILAVAIALPGCANVQPAQMEDPASALASGQANVAMGGFAFAPQELKVAVGTRVTWTNKDSAPHTVTSKDNVFESGNMEKGSEYSYTFDKPGAYEYLCKYHPRMVGKIVVQ